MLVGQLTTRADLLCNQRPRGSDNHSLFNAMLITIFSALQEGKIMTKGTKGLVLSHVFSDEPAKRVGREK